MINANLTGSSKENRSTSFTPLFNSTSTKSPQNKSWQDIVASQPAYALIDSVKQKGKTTALSPKQIRNLQKMMKKKEVIIPPSKTQLHPIIIDNSANLYAIHSTIAKGSTCRVKMVQNLQTLEWCVAKIISNNEERALSEIEILKKLNLLKGSQFRETKQGVHQSYLFTPLINGIKLKHFLQLVKQHQKTFTKTEQTKLLHSMLMVMKSLVDANINHGDIHDKNVMVDPLTLTVHLVDFGEATEIATNGTGNHHQHYDIRKFFSLLKPVITDHALHDIANQHLITWQNLKTNLQTAIDKVGAICAPLKENQTRLSR